jgi:hypothetical protein
MAKTKREGAAYWADKLVFHPPEKCAGTICTMHNMSNHHMRSFPQLWRMDRGIMERQCPHGIGHPDPDDYFCNTYARERVHGCDGCCFPPKTEEEVTSVENDCE